MQILAQPKTILLAIECEQAKSKSLPSMRKVLKKDRITPCFNEDDFARCAAKFRESLNKAYSLRSQQKA